MNFDAQQYADCVRIAGNAFRNGEKNTNKWAQQSLAAYQLGKLSLLQIAQLLYAEMKPLTAKGKDASPKESDNGSISVSSLRTANGGEAAKAAFGALQYIIANADVDQEAVNKFATEGGKVFTLKRDIASAKAAAAKADAEAIVSGSEQEREGDVETETETVPVAVTVNAFNDFLQSIDAASLTDSDQLALMGTIEAIGRIEADLQASVAPVAETVAA